MTGPVWIELDEYLREGGFQRICVQISAILAVRPRDALNKKTGEYEVVGAEVYTPTFQFDVTQHKHEVMERIRQAQRPGHQYLLNPAHLRWGQVEVQPHQCSCPGRWDPEKLRWVCSDGCDA